MTKLFCDRCGADVTGKPSAAVRGIADANPIGIGKITHERDLCPRCYRALLTWVKTKGKA